MDENNSNDSSKNQNEEVEEDNKLKNAKTPNSAKKNKKLKVKAWCGECFQFFENGPFAKVCREHLTKGKCDLVECSKKLINEDGVNCTRKFPNINSENRHTYCLTEEEVKEWDEKIKIQNCLGVKRNADRNYEKSKINSFIENKQSIIQNESPSKPSDKDINKNYFCTFKDKDYTSDKNKLNCKKNGDGSYEFDLNFENLFPQTNNQNYVYNLIDEINNLNFLEGEKPSIDDKLINEFDNIYFSSEKCDKLEKKFKKVEGLEKIEISNKNNFSDVNQEFLLKKEEIKDTEKIKESICIAEEKIIFSIKNDSEVKLDPKLNENSIKSLQTRSTIIEIIQDEEKIDSVFEKIHSTSKIPKSVLNKIKSAFKKKGICNAKTLRLYREKNKSWDFLVENFKNVCSQIEGVALCLENILEANHNKLENDL